MNIDYTQHYLKWHDESDNHRAAMIAHYQQLLTPRLLKSRDLKVLDIGCGMGFALLALREMGFIDLQGVEQDEGQAASCRSKHLDVTLTDNTIAFLEQRTGNYDLIISLDVLEHLPVGIQIEFVRSISRALRPEGQFICTVPNANSSLASRWRYIDWTHTTSFTEHSLDFLLTNGGLTDIKICGHEFNRRPKHVWLPVGGARHWWAFRFFRLFRRLEMMAELGPTQGRTIPLSLNLIDRKSVV